MNGYEREALGLTGNEKPSRFEQVALPTVAVVYCTWFYFQAFKAIWDCIKPLFQ